MTDPRARFGRALVPQDKQTDTTHACPCGCGGRVPRHQLACREGWFRLPVLLRAAVNEGYRRRATNPSMHRAALADALDWYRENPR